MEALSIKYRKFSTTESIIMHDGEENSAFLCLFYWMIQITLLKENLTFLTKRFSIRQILEIEKKQPSSRVEKIYVKTSFNIPLSVNQLENKVVVTTVITMLRFTDNK
jgi:hypothetical protein